MVLSLILHVFSLYFLQNFERLFALYCICSIYCSLCLWFHSSSCYHACSHICLTRRKSRVWVPEGPHTVCGATKGQPVAADMLLTQQYPRCGINKVPRTLIMFQQIIGYFSSAETSYPARNLLRTPKNTLAAYKFSPLPFSCDVGKFVTGRWAYTGRTQLHNESWARCVGCWFGCTDPLLWANMNTNTHSSDTF